MSRLSSIHVGADALVCAVEPSSTTDLSNVKQSFALRLAEGDDWAYVLLPGLRFPDA